MCWTYFSSHVVSFRSWFSVGIESDGILSKETWHGKKAHKSSMNYKLKIFLVTIFESAFIGCQQTHVTWLWGWALTSRKNVKAFFQQVKIDGAFMSTFSEINIIYLRPWFERDLFILSNVKLSTSLRQLNSSLEYPTWISTYRSDTFKSFTVIEICGRIFLNFFLFVFNSRREHRPLMCEKG